MPRELSDVLHYLLPDSPAGAPDDTSPPPEERRLRRGPPGPEAPSRSDDATRHEHEADEPGSESGRFTDGASPRSPTTFPAPRPGRAPDRPRTSASSALSIVAVPVDDEDPVRAALLWNLCVEIARRGGRSLLLQAEPADAGTAWPRAGRQPLGAELSRCRARSLGGLYRAAVDLALLHTAGDEPGLVLVQVPPAWLHAPGDGAALLDWTLLLTRPDKAHLREAWRLARLLVAARPGMRLGVTIHGAKSLGEAERGFGSFARAMRDHLGRDPSSYGLLADDLHVYRAATAERPIGLAHPQSLAARALHDVAGTLLDDALDLDVGRCRG